MKNTVPGTHINSDLNGEEIVGKFYEKELCKTSQKEFRVEKVIKRKENKLYVKWKCYDSSFNSSIDKKYILWMCQYFPKPKSLGANVKVKLDLSNYAPKRDLKNATGVDALDFVKKTDLASWKSDLDKWDIDKLKMYQEI